jgi:hypothetical protein
VDDVGGLVAAHGLLEHLPGRIRAFPGLHPPRDDEAGDDVDHDVELEADP